MEVERGATTSQMLSSWLRRGQDLWGSVNLTCILKGNNRGINSKLTLSGPSNSLGVTDVHDRPRLGRTSKGGQKRGREPPHVSTFPLLLRCSLLSYRGACRRGRLEPATSEGHIRGNANTWPFPKVTPAVPQQRVERLRGNNKEAPCRSGARLHSNRD